MLTQTKGFKAQITKQFKFKRSHRLTRIVEIGIMVVIIIGVAVVIPVVNSVIATANLTGTTNFVNGLKFQIHAKVEKRWLSYSRCSSPSP